jgi:hypothetical protein
VFVIDAEGSSQDHADGCAMKRNAIRENLHESLIVAGGGGLDGDGIELREVALRLRACDSAGYEGEGQNH